MFNYHTIRFLSAESIMHKICDMDVLFLVVYKSIVRNDKNLIIHSFKKEVRSKLYDGCL